MGHDKRILKSHFSREGFTLAEILVATGIIVVLSVMGFHTFILFRKTAELKSTVENAMSSLLEARAKTLSSRDAAQYGVHFEQDKMIIFKGSLYSPGDSVNQEILLPPRVEISAITLAGGGGEVIFKRFSGETDQSGTITFRLRLDPNETSSVSILASGVIHL